MRASSDVIVIGGGAAGVAAALAASRAGARTTLVRAAPGASALGTGGWTGPLDDVLADALRRAEHPMVAAPRPLPHPHGELRSFDFAHAVHVSSHDIDSAFLCGIAGLGAFAVPALARMYATSEDRPLAAGIAVMADTPADGWSPMSLAALIEREPHRLVDALRPVVPEGAACVIVPPVLGIDRAVATRDTVAQALGVDIVEMLGAPPSIPGLRLDRAFLRALRNADVEIVTGIAHGCDSSGGRVTRLHVAASGSARLMHADHFVLATGKYLGGGIATLPVSAREHAFVETALGLPVWIEHLDQTFTTAESLTLTSRVRTYDQPLLRAGVHTNADMRPIDSRMRTIFTNVAVVGSVCSESDALRGLGHAASHGLRALFEPSSLEN